MAGRKCSICNHPKRNEIDKSLAVDGAVLRAIAVQFRVSKDSLKRHVDNGHIAAKIQKAVHAHEAVEADDFLSRLVKRRDRFAAMAKEAQTAGDPHLELKVYQTESKFADMEGRALGAFREKVEHSGHITLHFDKEDAGL